MAAGANPDAGDRWCVTPLMYAVQTEWFDMAQLMISAGASVDLQDSRGRTPLILAVDCSEDVYDTIRYDTRCCFNVRSKADMNGLNLPHGDDN